MDSILQLPIPVTQWILSKCNGPTIILNSFSRYVKAAVIKTVVNQAVISQASAHELLYLHNVFQIGSRENILNGYFDSDTLDSFVSSGEIVNWWVQFQHYEGSQFSLEAFIVHTVHMRFYLYFWTPQEDKQI